MNSGKIIVNCWKSESSRWLAFFDIKNFSVPILNWSLTKNSTLEGLIFKWTILDKQHSNIRFIKFRDSSYALDPVLEEIESKGLQGDKVLLEGKVKK